MTAGLARVIGKPNSRHEVGSSADLSLCKVIESDILAGGRGNNSSRRREERRVLGSNSSFGGKSYALHDPSVLSCSRMRLCRDTFPGGLSSERRCGKTEVERPIEPLVFVV